MKNVSEETRSLLEEWARDESQSQELPELLGKLMKEMYGIDLPASELAEGAAAINEFLAMFPPTEQRRTREDKGEQS